MGARAAVLLPVRLEIRFGGPNEHPARLRVIVVPDVCWVDRRPPPTEAELDLLEAAVNRAQGPIVGSPGAGADQAANVAFDELARQIGPGRALWLALTFPPQRTGDRWEVPREPGLMRDDEGWAPRVIGLPDRIRLYADVDGELVLLDEHALERQFPIRRIRRPPDGQPTDADGWWPSWDDLERVGLTFDIRLDQHGIGPGGIAALYVVGLGDGDARELFGAHRDAGELSLVPPGTPTNTVSGAPAADLGREPAPWQALAEADPGEGDSALVGHALTGELGGLGPLLGGTRVPTGGDVASALVPLLWPALATTTLREVWGVGALDASVAHRWAANWLRPSGPLALLRIGSQPYGLWPVSTSQWRATDQPPEEEQLEAALAAGAGAVRHEMAVAARKRLGTVVDADATHLWELISQTPTSDAYEVRIALPLDHLLPTPGGDPGHVDDWWADVVSQVARNVVGEPTLRLVTLGEPRPLPLGLVLPPLDEPSTVPILAHPDMSEEHARDLLTEAPRKWLGEALGFLRQSFAEQGLVGDHTDYISWWPASLLWRLLMLSGFLALDAAQREAADAHGTLGDTSPPLARRIMDAPTLDPAPSGGPLAEDYRGFGEKLLSLAEWCDHPHVVPLVEHELRCILDTSSHRVDPWLTALAWRRLRSLDEPRPLGLYGWVDAPDRGTPGPDDRGGLVLAPSDLQARTAVLLRDKALRTPDGTWQLDLSSKRVRAATRLADDVRAGAHPHEALGREVERRVQTREKIDVLRRNFPLRTEHAGRRTCDGHEVLLAAQRSTPDQLLAEAGLNADELTQIRELQDVLDAYADLLVAGAAQHLVERRPDAAAHAMDAAAGLAVPPELGLLATRTQGRSVRTTVLAVLPTGGGAIAADRASPAALASPAWAAWVAQETGPADGPSWTWQVRGPDGPEAAITLQDLGLHAGDAVILDDAALDDLVLMRFDPGTVVKSRPPAPDLVRRLAGLLGARPPSAGDLDRPDGATAHWDQTVAAQLTERTRRAVEAAQRLVAELRAAATDEQRRVALAEARRWAVDVGDDDLIDRTSRAADELGARVESARSAALSHPDEAAATLIALVAPGHRLPLLVDTTPADLAALAGTLTPEPLDASQRPRLDTTWLELVAAVRPAMAKLEAHQACASFEDHRPLHAATNHPDDPWLQQPGESAPGKAPPLLVVAYGPHPLLPSGDAVAVGVIDTWSERIPATAHVAGGAFHFNAPASRAPQAILLAVTPDPDRELDVDVVAEIVAEARSSAHARMARPDDLGRLDVLLPAGILPAYEPGGFQYEAEANHEDWGA